MPIPKNHLRWLRAHNFERCAKIVRRQGSVCEVVGEIPAGCGVYAICDTVERIALYVGQSSWLPMRIATHRVAITGRNPEYRYTCINHALDDGAQLALWVRTDVIAETSDGLQVNATLEIEELVIKVLDPRYNLRNGNGSGGAIESPRRKRNPRWFATYEEAVAAGDGRLPPIWDPEKGWKPFKTTPSMLRAEAMANEKMP